MPRADFSHVTDWVFDLDNTLYPPQARLFDQIEQRMTAFVMRTLGLSRGRADQVRRDYWHGYGTTLAGLMHEHGLDPADYLVEVHDIDLGALSPDPGLAARIRALPGRKIVYTNGSAPYAERVVAARGLGGVFDALYGVEHADFHPKPDARAFHAVFDRAGWPPPRRRCSRTTRATWPRRTPWACVVSTSPNAPPPPRTCTTIPTILPRSLAGWSERPPCAFGGGALSHCVKMRLPCCP